jgi:hypothetical protein
MDFRPDSTTIKSVNIGSCHTCKVIFKGTRKDPSKKFILGLIRIPRQARLWQYNFKTLLEISETKLKIVRGPATFYPTAFH